MRDLAEHPQAPLHRWRLGPRRELVLDQPRIMAILNVTPDSFSDGGELDSVRAVVEAARRAMAEGASVLDIGGESTRPGAEPVAEAEQIRRVVPAIAAVRRELGDGLLITVDTTRAAVARAALEAGADGVNDVSGGTDDARMLPLVAERRCGVVLMHRRTTPRDDRYSTEYVASPAYEACVRGVVSVVTAFLHAQANAAERAGVCHDAIVLDPGLGFGKSVDENFELIRRSPELCALGYPVLAALSRKSFTGAAAGLAKDAPPKERLHATLGLSVMQLMLGTRLFRVHDVRAHAEALGAAWRLEKDDGMI